MAKNMIVYFFDNAFNVQKKTAKNRQLNFEYNLSLNTQEGIEVIQMPT